MSKASIKNKIPFILLLFWSYSASADSLSGMKGIGNFYAFIFLWFTITLTGVIISTVLKDKHSNLKYKQSQHFFLIGLSTFFLTLLWMLLKKESSDMSVLEKFTSDQNKELKTIFTTIGFGLLITTFFIIRKDYKGKDK